MPQNTRVTFHASSPPYEPGDVAGFPAALAQRLVDRGVASFTDTAPVVDFAAMTRAELVRYAVDVLGIDGEPPAEVSDDDLRAGLAAQAELARAGAAAVSTDPADLAPVLDQLDALDRAHLEAFAKTKAGMAEIDPTLTDDELRAQIRAVADVGGAADKPVKGKTKA